MLTVFGALAAASFVGILVASVLTTADIGGKMCFKKWAFYRGRVVLEGELVVPLSSPLRLPGSGQTTHLKYVVLPSMDILVRGRVRLFRLGSPQLCRAVLRGEGQRFSYSVRVPWAFFAIYFFFVVFAILIGLVGLAHDQGGFLWTGPLLGFPLFFVGLGALILFSDLRRTRRALPELAALQSVA
jgi:hypothetical protein